ncbi:MAG: hypothetical protein E6Q97_00800 [Desulfurellales bacterium]|nr:MAG: hypothetical protein E6Q97_00800 [Desulfurellales bacterium]
MAYVIDPFTGDLVYAPSYNYAPNQMVPASQQPGLGNQAAGLAGQVGGAATAGYVGNALVGSGSAGAPAATPLVGALAEGAPVGVEAAAATPELMGPGIGAAVEASAPASPWALSGIGSAGNYLLPAAGAVGALDLFANKRDGARGVAQGAASGAAIGSTFGPTGALVGGGVGGLIGLANGLLHKPKTKVEDSRYEKLRKKGVKGFEAPFRESRYVDKGEILDLSKPLDFKGRNDAGEWTNNAFAFDRNEDNLTGTDVQGYALFGEAGGDKWGNLSLDKKIKIGDELLSKKLLREHHGTIDPTDSEAFQNEFSRLLTQYAGG